MKNIKYTIILIILATVVLLTGCQNSSLKLAQMIIPDNPQAKEDVDTIIYCLNNEEYDGIYDIVVTDDTKEEIIEIFKDIKSDIRDDFTNPQKYNYSTNKRKYSNQDKTYNIREMIYLVQSGKDQYFISLTYTGEGDSEYELSGIWINQNLSYVVNRGVLYYKPIDYVLLVYTFVCYGLIVLAFILCLKTKIRKKALWIILILMTIGVSYTRMPTSVNTRFLIFNFLGNSKYLLYAHGGTHITILVPIYAIIFLVLRKKLAKKYIDHMERAQLSLANEQSGNEIHSEPDSIDENNTEADNDSLSMREGTDSSPDDNR